MIETKELKKLLELAKKKITKKKLIMLKKIIHNNKLIRCLNCAMALSRAKNGI